MSYKVTSLHIFHPLRPGPRPARPLTNYWFALASSADGHTLVAVIGGGGQGGPIFTSTNSGATWTPADGAHTTYRASVASKKTFPGILPLVAQPSHASRITHRVHVSRFS